jgi:hypothetical protein
LLILESTATTLVPIELYTVAPINTTMSATARRGIRKEKSLDLDDVFGGFGLPPEMNKSTPDGGDDSDSDAKSISHAPREQFTPDLSAGDMSDSGRSVSSTRSHSKRGHRKRVVVDRSRTRSKDSLSALNKSVESGLFSYKDGDSDEEDENLLLGDSEKAERPKVKSSSKSSERPTIAAAKEKQALERAKLRDRMRRERSPKRDSEKEHNADTKKESSKKRRSNEKERSTKRSDSHGSRKEEKERSTHKTEHGEHTEKERSSGKRRSKDKERSTHSSRKEESEPTEPALPTPQPYRSKTEKKPKEQPYEPACPTPQPYRSKTQKKKKEPPEEPALPTPQPYRSKTEKKSKKQPQEPALQTRGRAEEKETSSKKVASSALDETMRHDNLSLSPMKPTKQLKKAPLSPTSPAHKSPTRKVKRTQSRKVDHAEEEEKKEEKPRKKLVLRRPSLKGEQSPRSLTEAEESWAEEASRASTHQSGATTDDDDDVSDDGTVLQFDPTQSDNVYRVKQIQREDSIYNIKNVDGKVVTGHIGEINDSLSNEPKQDVPVFNALGNDDDLSSSQSEAQDDVSSPSDSESESSYDEDEDAPIGGPMQLQDNWHESFVLAPSGGEEELSDPSGDETVLMAPSGGEEEEESETITPLEPKAPPRERRAPGRSKSEILQPFPPSDQKAPRRKAPGRCKSSDFGGELLKASDPKKKKVRRKQVGDIADLDGPSDSELDSPQKPRRRLKKKGGNIDPPSLGAEHEDPSDLGNLNRRAVMKPKRNSGPDGQPHDDTSPETLASGLTAANLGEHSKATSDTATEDEGDSKQQNKRMSMGMAIGRYFGRSSRRNSAQTDAEESDDGGSIGGSVHGGVFGRKKNKHMLLGDDDSSFSSGGDGATPF